MGNAVVAVQNKISGAPKVNASANSPEPAQVRVPQPPPQPIAPAAPPKAASIPAAATVEPHVTAARTVPAAPRAPAQTATPTLARIELAADTLEVAPLQSVASVAVVRRHSYHNGVSFSWWTESGTAKPGQDFVPVKPRTDYIPAGESETHLLIPIVADPRRRLAKTFYVVVGDPSADAALGSRTITMVTIPGVN